MMKSFTCWKPSFLCLSTMAKSPRFGALVFNHGELCLRFLTGVPCLLSSHVTVEFSRLCLIPLHNWEKCTGMYWNLNTMVLECTGISKVCSTGNVTGKCTEMYWNFTFYFVWPPGLSKMYVISWCQNICSSVDKKEWKMRGGSSI